MTIIVGTAGSLHAASVLNDAGEMLDEKMKEPLQKFMRGFVQFVHSPDVERTAG